MHDNGSKTFFSLFKGLMKESVSEKTIACSAGVTLASECLVFS